MTLKSNQEQQQGTKLFLFGCFEYLKSLAEGRCKTNMANSAPFQQLNSKFLTVYI